MRVYDSRVPIVACPFCREMFEEGEERACPVCGVALTPFEKLPPSHDARWDDDVPNDPEYEPLPATYMGRSKGALALLGLTGLALFFLPWISVTLPDIFSLTGMDIARRLVWPWGAGVAWVVLVPTVLSRRSVVQMRGARVAAAFLSAIPAITGGVLLMRPPHATLVPIRFTYAWPFWGTVGVSLLAAAVAVRFGGRLDDIKVSRGTSVGHDVH